MRGRGHSYLTVRGEMIGIVKDGLLCIHYRGVQWEGGAADWGSIM